MTTFSALATIFGPTLMFFLGYWQGWRDQRKAAADEAIASKRWTGH